MLTLFATTIQEHLALHISKNVLRDAMRTCPLWPPCRGVPPRIGSPPGLRPVGSELGPRPCLGVLFIIGSPPGLWPGGSWPGLRPRRGVHSSIDNFGAVDWARSFAAMPRRAHLRARRSLRRAVACLFDSVAMLRAPCYHVSAVFCNNRAHFP